MLRIGEHNTLHILSRDKNGASLEGGEFGPIFLPGNQIRTPIADTDTDIRVFIYRDSKQRLIATQQKPSGEVGQVSYLKVAECNPVGAFLDWGLKKELLAPFHEQLQRMQEGSSYLVMLFLDDERRIAASAKLDEFLSDENDGKFIEGQEVDLVIADKTDIGIKAVVDHSHWGVLYNNEVFQTLQKGDKVKGFIKKIRDDDRLDIALQKSGFNQERMDTLSHKILVELEKQGGFLAMDDKTAPAKISNVFGVSKKQFKQAIGKLYKQRLIEFKDKGIQKL